jgi:hypothetical protein
MEVAAAAEQRCPKGHVSSTLDYCSECGAKLEGAETSAMPALAGGALICPKCGATHEGSDLAFCEICGFDFGQGGQPISTEMHATNRDTSTDPTGEPESPEAPVVPAAATTRRWQVVVSVDAALNESKELQPPQEAVAGTWSLEAELSLIGRLDETRGIRPEIPITNDDAVSRRHALLQQAGEGKLLVRDIGSANGTRLNGEALEPMADRELSHGDELTLGHWTRLRVEAL